MGLLQNFPAGWFFAPYRTIRLPAEMGNCGESENPRNDQCAELALREALKATGVEGKSIAVTPRRRLIMPACEGL